MINRRFWEFTAILVALSCVFVGHDAAHAAGSLSVAALGRQADTSPTPGALAPSSPAGIPDQNVPSDGQTDEPVQKLPERTVKPVHYGEEGLPAAVKAARQKLLDAAATGNIDALRPLFAQQPGGPPSISADQQSGAVDELAAESGDEAGREILAILIDLLESGWVVSHPGTPEESYVWPYFADYPLDKLTPKQEVELYRILSAADVEDMRRAGGYTFYRIEIAPNGRIKAITTDQN